MKTIELSTTPIKSVRLTLYDGKAVVRNQNRINALIGVRKSSIPPQYHGLLANAVFGGNEVNEYITWTTDVFTGEPTTLDQLPAAQQEAYRKTLSDAMQAYALAFRDAEPGVKGMIQAAVTYMSDANVFCHDGRVVITQWGMGGKAGEGPMGMPISIDDKVPAYPAGTTSDGNKQDTGSQPSIDNGAKPDDNQNQPPEDNLAGSPASEQDADKGPIGAPSGGGNGTNPGGTNPGDEGNAGENSEGNNGGGGSNAGGNYGGGAGGGGKKKGCIWRWLLPLLLILAALLIFLLMRGCSARTPLVSPGPVAFTGDNVVLDKDSITYVIDNRLLVVVRNNDKTLDEFAEAFYQKYGRKNYQFANADSTMHWMTLILPADQRDEMCDKLPREFPDYDLLVMPDRLNKTSYKPSDPGFRDKKKSWHHDDTEVYDAWDITKGDSTLIVAVIDDGFDLDHPELKGKIVKPYNSITKSSKITLGSGHGTHVAGLAVGSMDNGTGASGVAPNCLLMPIQAATDDGFPMSAVLDAVAYAIDNGADIINMSFGPYYGKIVQYIPEYVQRNMRETLFKDEEALWDYIYSICEKNNISVVMAAGNENILTGIDPKQRNPYGIKVAATQPDHYKTDFSNWGDYATVSAPGLNIYSSVPDDDYDYYPGTSMSSPIVAGGVALLRAKNPSLTNSEIIHILQVTGTHSPSNVGPIVNFGRALNYDPATDGRVGDDDCEKINARYNELLEELERLKREHPECIEVPDTMVIPEDMTLDKLIGKWKSTTPIESTSGDEVVLYFTFNGTSQARLEIVEPDGTVFMAPLVVSISGDEVHIDQSDPARCPTASGGYAPYTFDLKPDRYRKAVGKAQNKFDRSNFVSFKLVRIN